jgi:2-methylcitrate dehydratase PrpD
MENILFKVSFPAEFHAQTAVEAAVWLHPELAGRLEAIEKIIVETQEAAMRIIDKTGPLDNPADRDHCLQYMVAIGLLCGDLEAGHYEDASAADPRIDKLRSLMEVVENKQFSADYLDPGKRSIGNAIEVIFKDGTRSPRVEVAYPLGHRRRREEALPLLESKFRESLETRFEHSRCESLARLWEDPSRLDAMPVNEFMDLFAEDGDSDL